MKSRNRLVRLRRCAVRDGAPGDDGARVTRQGVGQFRADDHGAGQRNAGRRRPTRATCSASLGRWAPTAASTDIADWFLEWREFPESIPRRSPASAARPSSSPARASTRPGTRTRPIPGEFGYNASSDGAPIGFAGNGGELWRIEYLVTNPVTDAAADISYRFDDVFQCQAFPAGSCPGTPGSASLRIDAIPEPSTLLAARVRGLAGASRSLVHRGLRRCG